MEAAAVQIAASLLGPLVEEIAAALREGLDEEAATQRALDRMRGQPLPAPLLPRVRAMIARERAR